MGCYAADCTSGGIKTDTKLGAWCWAGWVKWVDASVDPEPEPTQTATVTAARGKTVNLRKSNSKSSAVLKRVPIGATVSVVSHGDAWTKVTYNGTTGYMMTEYLAFS